LKLFLVSREFAASGKFLVHQQVGNLLEFGLVGEVEDVIAAVVQVVAGAPTVHRAVFPATTPDRATDFLGLAGLASGEELIQFLFVRVIVQELVQLIARLHVVDEVFLRPFS